MRGALGRDLDKAAHLEHGVGVELPPDRQPDQDAGTQPGGHFRRGTPAQGQQNEAGRHNGR